MLMQNLPSNTAGFCTVSAISVVARWLHSGPSQKTKQKHRNKLKIASLDLASIHGAFSPLCFIELFVHQRSLRNIITHEQTLLNISSLLNSYMFQMQ